MISRALELAARGAGQVSPGPLVGCLIVGRGGETVGEGFYIYERVKHAETLALEQAGARARGATAYVARTARAHGPHAALHRGAHTRRSRARRRPHRRPEPARFGARLRTLERGGHRRHGRRS